MGTGRRLGEEEGEAPQRTGGGAPSQVPREEEGRHPGITCQPEQTLTPRTLRAKCRVGRGLRTARPGEGQRAVLRTHWASRVGPGL